MPRLGTLFDAVLPPALRDPTHPERRRARYFAACAVAAASAAGLVLLHRLTDPGMAGLGRAGVWLGVATTLASLAMLRLGAGVDRAATLLLCGAAIFIPVDAVAWGGLRGNGLGALVCLPVLAAFLLRAQHAALLAGAVAVGLVVDAILAWTIAIPPPPMTGLGRVADVGTSLVLLFVMSLLALVNERERRALHAQVAEREARYAAAIDADHAGVFEWRSIGGFVMLSPRLQAMLEGAPLAAVFAPAGVQALEHRLAALEEGQRATVELVRRRGDSLEWFRVDLLGVSREPGRGAVGIVRDVTEARRATHLKDEFIAVVSHELRTPLTAIHGAVALLHHGAARIPDEPARSDERRLLTVAHTNSTRLLGLVDDLLDVQRLEAGGLHFERVRVAVLDRVRHTMDGLAGIAAASGTSLTLEGSSDAHVAVDPRRFEQALANLVVNACKWNTPGAPVVLRLDEADGRVRVAVLDQGPGVPESFRPHLFDRFTQAAVSTDRPRPGTGLGLFIARSFTERMGGTIAYEPLPTGSAFWLEFPVVR